LPSAQASACAVSAAASGVASASSSSVGTWARAVPIWNNVAREQDPASTAAAPSTCGSTPTSSETSSPARRKFSGRPMATPEPPVISAWPEAASPMANRCASVTASMMA
jgi:hypothetical protein